MNCVLVIEQIKELKKKNPEFLQTKQVTDYLKKRKGPADESLMEITINCIPIQNSSKNKL